MIDFLPIARFALLLVRPGLIVMVAPGFGGVYAPAQVKLGLIVMLSVGLVPSVGVPDAEAIGQVGLAMMIAREIAIGMALALEFSARRGLMQQADADRAIKHLAAVGLPTKVSEVRGGVSDVDRLMTLIGQDKKVSRGKLTFILARGIGNAFVAPDVDATDVRAFMAEKLA